MTGESMRRSKTHKSRQASAAGRSVLATVPCGVENKLSFTLGVRADGPVILIRVQYPTYQDSYERITSAHGLSIPVRSFDDFLTGTMKAHAALSKRRAI